MRPLKSLTLEAIIELLATTFGELEDPRAADQLTYPLRDTVMSGFALMFFQHPSLLQFQRAMQQKRRRCNLQTIFGMHEVPSDTQMREILDGVEPEPLRGLLPQLCEKVRRVGWGGRFTTPLPSGQHQGTYYTVALDGSEYFHSTRIQCTHCLRQRDQKGRIHSSHLVVGATLVRAGSHQVLPIDAEEVRNPTAESQPQDCELTAGKRVIARLRHEQPQMPLALESAVRVTYVEVWEHTAGGELRYHNSWITDLDVTAENVAVVVTSGRTRWKIENEHFNVHKNHGYELTHNYGHGQHTLSMVFYLLNLLAYVAHVIVELGDRLYQRCRAQESRRELWAALRTMLHAVLVKSWDQLLLGDLEEEAPGP